jgi:hypothetical protein
MKQAVISQKSKQTDVFPRYEYFVRVKAFIESRISLRTAEPSAMSKLILLQSDSISNSISGLQFVR